MKTDSSMRYSKTRYAVISDFDGTITRRDVGDFLLLHFKLVKKKEIDLGYELNVPVEKWMTKYFSRIGKIKKDLIEKAVKKHISPRHLFRETALFCRRKKIPFEVVSGGVDLYANPFFQKEKLKMKTFFGSCRTKKGKAEIRYPYLKGISLSQFKKSRVEFYKKKGYTVIFCGDAPNDVPAAMTADIAFASRFLPSLLESKKVPYRRLIHFGPVLKILKSAYK